MSSDLFTTRYREQNSPLAAKMRPKTLEQFVGQEHILAPGMPLQIAIVDGKPHSMIFWGPPGTGKTTLARIIANVAHAQFISLSAVMSGVKEIRDAISQAQTYHGQTILFIDEIHRFNKSQQDAFLPYVEDGTITLIGATTENPSFELNNALLSRVRVYQLRSLELADIKEILVRAVNALNKAGSEFTIEFESDALQYMATAADGDARYGLNLLDLAIIFASVANNKKVITDDTVNKVLTESVRRFDKGGDIFYDQISALHKSVRGSSPDAALYWLARMLDGGCDPLYIARRVVRMATEDIGNADPRGLQVALNAWDTQQRLGSPEGELALAQAITYLACAPKSNAVYMALKAAMADAREYGSLPVPDHICNAPTKLMSDIGKNAGYRYDHNEPNAIAFGQRYFPNKMPNKIYYHPTPRGLEQKISEKLKAIREAQT